MLAGSCCGTAIEISCILWCCHKKKRDWLRCQSLLKPHVLAYSSRSTYNVILCQLTRKLIHIYLIPSSMLCQLSSAVMQSLSRVHLKNLEMTNLRNPLFNTLTMSCIGFPSTSIIFEIILYICGFKKLLFINVSIIMMIILDWLNIEIITFWTECCWNNRYLACLPYCCFLFLFVQGKESYLSVIKKHVDIHATVFVEQGGDSVLPKFVTNHGILSGPELHKLLQESKVQWLF